MLCILTVKNCQGPQELYQSLGTAAYGARYNFHHSHLLQLHCEICCVAEALCQKSLKPTSDSIMLHLHLYPWVSMWTAKSQILQVYTAFDLHHLSGALLPDQGVPARYAQLYIHDPVTQLQIHEQRNHNLNSVIMT